MPINRFGGFQPQAQVKKKKPGIAIPQQAPVEQNVPYPTGVGTKNRMQQVSGIAIPQDQQFDPYGLGGGGMPPEGFMDDITTYGGGFDPDDFGGEDFVGWDPEGSQADAPPQGTGQPAGGGGYDWDPDAPFTGGHDQPRGQHDWEYGQAGPGLQGQPPSSEFMDPAYGFGVSDDLPVGSSATGEADLIGDDDSFDEDYWSQYLEDVFGGHVVPILADNMLRPDLQRGTTSLLVVEPCPPRSCGKPRG